MSKNVNDIKRDNAKVENDGHHGNCNNNNHGLICPHAGQTNQPNQQTYVDWNDSIFKKNHSLATLFHAEKNLFNELFPNWTICISLPPSWSRNNGNNQANSIAKSSHLFSSLELTDCVGGGGTLKVGNRYWHPKSVNTACFVFNFILNLFKENKGDCSYQGNKIK